ncbi:MAG: carbohydrate kinase [Polyangiaceae bacterium]|nr:carbohydrate kinase [Polyangiaceae bacterium]
MRTGALVVCWGELLWDLFPDGPRLGGAAANVAFHLARLGERPLLVSRVGGDALGRRALATLTDAGVDVSGVQLDPDAPTGTARVRLEDGQPRFELGDSAAWDRLALTERVRDALEGPAEALVFGTLAQRTALGGAALHAAARAATGKHRVVDLNLRPPHDSFGVARASLELATAVKLNEHELARVGAGAGAPDAIAWLEGMETLRHVAVTRGAAGASLSSRGVGGEWGRSAAPGVPAAAPPGEEADPVGAGDAWTAVFVHWLVRGGELEQLPARANAYAGAVAARRGAMPALEPLVVAAARLGEPARAGRASA